MLFRRPSAAIQLEELSTLAGREKGDSFIRKEPGHMWNLKSCSYGGNSGLLSISV